MKNKKILMNYEKVAHPDSPDKPSKRHLNLAEIYENCVALINGHNIFSVNLSVIVDDGGKILILEKTDALFAWFGRIGLNVVWTHGGCSKNEFFQFMRQDLRQYDRIDKYPHFPKIPNVYYCASVPKKEYTGAIDELLSLWEFHSDFDRDLAKAFICTSFWGGPTGTRPAFFIEGDGGADGHDKNRGVGKSELAKLAASLTDTSSIDCSPRLSGEEIAKKVSNSSADTRVIVFDNVKSIKLSNGDLEGFITSEAISGWKIYTGQISVGNYFSWVFTMNEASMSNDFATRAVCIRLSRPQYHTAWGRKKRDLIKNRRDDIISDIQNILARPAVERNTSFRFSDWYLDVMSKVNPSDEFDKKIKERQASVDGDDDDGEDISEKFCQEISDRVVYGVNHNQEISLDPSTGVILVSKAIAAKWVRDLLNTKYMSTRCATSLIKRSRVPGILGEFKTKTARCWVFSFVKNGNFKGAYLIDNNLRNVKLHSFDKGGYDIGDNVVPIKKEGLGK